MRNTTSECFDVARLMFAGQALVQSITVFGDVLTVTGLKCVDDCLDCVQSVMRISGLSRGEVRVHSGTVPVALDRFVGE